jgi:hypothetical protein
MTDSPLARMAAAAAALATLAAMAWMELPPWQRELMARMVRCKTRSVVTRLARASGYRAMGRELAGAPQSEAGYARTFRLSLLRDRL